MRVLASLVLVVLVSAGTHASAQGPAPAFADPARVQKLESAFDAIRAGMPEALKQVGAPGLAWGIIIDGKLAASGGVGTHENGGAPVTPASVFRIASMTKSFTALAILALRDDGKLSLDDAVSTHVPGFAKVALPTRDAPAITIRHLMTHGEGFPEDNPWGDRQLAIAEATLDEWLAKGLPFSTSPGTEFEYSNYGFALLGRIVSNVSGMPYNRFIRLRILEPLGMRDTVWDAKDVPPAKLAHGHRRQRDGGTREDPLPHGAFGAMGGLYTSADDLAKYVAFMLSAWPPRDEDDRGPVRRSSVREMQIGQRPTGLTVTRPNPSARLNATTRAYGYGLNAAEDCTFGHVVSHGGGLPGYGSTMQWLPEYGVGVIVMANVTYAGAGLAGRQILDHLAATGGLEPRKWPASQPLIETRERVTALINQWSDAGMDALAADNLLLDRSRDRRRDDFARLRELAGPCRVEGDLVAENWLRGSFDLTCERRPLRVTFTLSPTVPPRVQSLSVTENIPTAREKCAQ
jgi:CubicO group peptidase (beta-lactamase class C family)